MARWKSLGKRAQIGIAIVALVMCSVLYNACTGGDEQAAVEPTSAPQGLVDTSDQDITEAPTDVPPTEPQPTDSPVPEPTDTELPPSAEPTAVTATEVPATEAPPATAVEQPTEPPAQVPQAPSGCIDINTASFDELRRIINIDEDYAQQIIDLRQQRPFRSVDELTRVKGIGDARLVEIKAEGLACVG